MNDKVDYITNNEEIISIADAIRSKGGTSALLKYPGEFVSAILNILTQLPWLDKIVTPSTSDVDTKPDSGKALYKVTTKAVTLNATAGHILSGQSVSITSNGKTISTVSGTIPSKSSGDMTISGATVTAPAGYYGKAASKSVASGSATTPKTSISCTSSISRYGNRVTFSCSGSADITPTISAGYVSSGTSGTVSASGSSYYDIPTEEGTASFGGGKSTTPLTPSSGKLFSKVHVPAGYTPKEYSDYGSSKYDSGYSDGYSAGSKSVLPAIITVSANTTKYVKTCWNISGDNRPCGAYTVPTGKKCKLISFYGLSYGDKCHGFLNFGDGTSGRMFNTIDDLKWSSTITDAGWVNDSNYIQGGYLVAGGTAYFPSGDSGHLIYVLVSLENA